MSTPVSPRQPRFPRALPLRPLDLRGAPCGKRALAWSPDAELAVAVDDSVYVYVPQWPQKGGEGGKEEEEENDINTIKQEEDDDDNDAVFPEANATAETETRSQFATGSRHIPVAYPPLDPRVNDRLFAAAAEETTPSSGDEGGEEEDDEEDRYPNWHGALPGLLTSSESTMRSVVALAWSPAGVGHNRRPVLGVLAADGLLNVYGEGRMGDPDDSQQGGLRGGHSSTYDTARWTVLWAVGGGDKRFLLPLRRRGRRRQGRNRAPDRIISFAWSAATPTAPAYAAAAALLVYLTDRREVVVVSVGRWPSGAWRVVEEGRFDASGPHAAAAARLPYGTAHAGVPGHPHFVPSGTVFGVQCSPFAAVEGNSGQAHLSSVVAYMADGYIGFRRVDVSLGPAAQPPAVTIDAQDTDGLCLFLGTDAFLVWEEAVWVAEGGRAVCRGVVATPMVARAFEVTWSGQPPMPGRAARPQPPPPPPARPHDRASCNTLYPPPDEHRMNPIQDLLLLPPPDPTRASPAPLYTLVRQSATATNDDWYESNVPAPSSGADDDVVYVDKQGGTAAAARPQWAEDIARTVHAHVPGVLARMGEGEDEEEEEEVDVEEEEGGGALGGLRLLADPADGATLAADDNIYLHRMRLWGVAQAPGRGRRAVTAVLVTGHAAQHADRSGWYRDRSRVLFGWSMAAAAPSATGRPPAQARAQLVPVSTEARMWAWMYGGGEDPLAAAALPVAAATATEATPAVPVHPLVIGQTCSICAAPLVVPGSTLAPPPPVCTRNGSTIACARGHVFDRCGATGLAIPQPGVSRVCGVCGSRTLRAGALAGALAATIPPAAGLSADALRHAEARLRQAIRGDVCGRCGGKFND